MWDMSLAIQLGYWQADLQASSADSRRPTNMRNLTGFCSTISGATVTPPFTDAFPASATGGAGAATVAASALAQYAWPPAMSAADQTYLYTQTQRPFTMPVYSPTANSAAGVAAVTPSGNGWANPAQTALFYTLASGTQCAYHTVAPQS